MIIVLTVFAIARGFLGGGRTTAREPPNGGSKRGTVAPSAEEVVNSSLVDRLLEFPADAGSLQRWCITVSIPAESRDVVVTRRFGSRGTPSMDAVRSRCFT